MPHTLKHKSKWSASTRKQVFTSFLIRYAFFATVIWCEDFTRGKDLVIASCLVELSDDVFVGTRVTTFKQSSLSRLMRTKGVSYLCIWQQMQTSPPLWWALWRWWRTCNSRSFRWSYRQNSLAIALKVKRRKLKIWDVPTTSKRQNILQPIIVDAAKVFSSVPSNL